MTLWREHYATIFSSLQGDGCHGAGMESRSAVGESDDIEEAEREAIIDQFSHTLSRGARSLLDQADQLKHAVFPDHRSLADQGDQKQYGVQRSLTDQRDLQQHCVFGTSEIDGDFVGAGSSMCLCTRDGGPLAGVTISDGTRERGRSGHGQRH
eukprot:TRINITY_DN58337_c0_g1_i1.p1 TRINITY_DN58337_c0_g1~~TRINITY_DN58337_c0_g1_i1.p1  ORF type:complete len:153 (-),score=15.08 TRINITY_DN58337_c0_g1_i1:76-534(-)